jgi:hypothetical protein
MMFVVTLLAGHPEHDSGNSIDFAKLHAEFGRMPMKSPGADLLSTGKRDFKGRVSFAPSQSAHGVGVQCGRSKLSA